MPSLVFTKLKNAVFSYHKPKNPIFAQVAFGINKSYEWNEKGVDKFYLIMEWMDAGDLSTMLKTIPG